MKSKYDWQTALLLVVIFISFRLIGQNSGLHNFQPLGAFLFCGAVCLGTTWLWLPLAAWAISYPITSIAQSYPVGAESLLVLFAFAITVALGIFFKKKGQKSTGKLILGSCLAALAFFFVTNLTSFFVDARYPKNTSGLLAALWTGLPSDAIPTWHFFRNSLAAHILFGTLFGLAWNGVPQLTLSKRPLPPQTKAYKS